MTVSAGFRIGLCILALASGLAAAPAGGARIAWSTYLRSGPGSGFTVVDELEHDAVVTLGPCADGWCRVSDGRAEGFVDRDALDLRRAPVVAPAAPADCVVAAQVGDRHSAPTRFCRAGP